jgi:type III secretion protein V
MNTLSKEPLVRSTIYTLTRELFLKGNRSEIIAAILVVAIVISMILPLPTWLLDVLIAINISVSCFLIILVMQIKHSVHLSTFPALLLITTLFRVSINVASTRQILLEGNAGHIIEAFGEVVVGGNIVVGLVVFIILTIVQFLVITKGSERVAEVGARFTLDAMPGKQLAIDIDAKNGNISAEEAQTRRNRLATESQFFGAMDGALKFVKGDAIAGILITLTNLIGGMIIGITQRQLSAGEAAHLYTILSVGDALVAQVPALLTSITAGLLITRISGVTERDSGHVGRQITQQVTDYPKAWVTASIAIAAFGLVPGMPWYVFVVLSAGAALFGFVLLRKEAEKFDEPAHPKYTDFDEVREFQLVFPFLLRFKSTQDNPEARVELVRVARRTRNNLVLKYGLVSPAIETQSDVDLIDAEAEFCHNEVRVFKMDIPCGHRVATCRSADIDAMGVQAIHSEPHPWHQEKSLFWLSKDLHSKLDELDIYHVSDWEYLEKAFESALFRLAPKHFGVEQASKLMKWLSFEHPAVAQELERIISIQRFADVIQRLLLEKVSIRNIVRISEILIEWGQKERDPMVLVECVRNGISREIANSNGRDLILSGLLLDPSTEERIRSSIRQTSFGDFLSLEPEYIEKLKDSLHDLLKNANEGESKVILTAPDIRLHIRNLFGDKFDEIAVMSTPEVPPDFKVQVLGVISEESSLPSI